VQEDLKPRLTLVLGGARSGKSTFAERLALERAGSGRVTYLATAEANDDEMRERIALHQAERPAGWSTLECPLDVAGAVRARAAQTDVFLLDCVTFWVSNLLFAAADFGGRVPEGLGNFDKNFIGAAAEQAAARSVASAVDDFVAALAETGAALVAVSNEVGLGLVPEYPLSRLYRDTLGRTNARLAAVADQVYFLVAGLPIELKALSSSPLFPPSSSSTKEFPQ
jgi:adenosylcobinamide kinase/adenosylcobinamide-phosphate guanylyltransferase